MNVHDNHHDHPDASLDAVSPAAEVSPTTDAQPEMQEPATPFPKSRRTPKLHHIKHAWHSPIPEKDKNTRRESLTLPTVAAERIDEINADLRNIELADITALEKWVESARLAATYYPRLQRWTDTVNREGSEFSQSVPSPAGDLAMRSGTIGDLPDGVKLVGKQALQYVRAKMGMGTIKSIPLWHSGFWVKIRNPPESALLDLYRRLSESKVSLGRQTGGLVFANTRVFATSMVVDFAIDYIHDSTINMPNIDYHSLINSNDIPILIAGLAHAIYSNGFNFTTQCMAKPEECHHIIKQRADISKMLHVDLRRLSEKQITHMARFMGRNMSIQQVQDYQSEFAASNEKVHDVGDGVRFFLKSPTIKQYCEIGETWVNGVIAMVNGALGVEVADGARDAYISKQSQATILRQYQHYVSRIECDEAVIDSQAEIGSMLSDWSTVQSTREMLTDAVGAYIDNSTFAVVATTDFECPACHCMQNDHSKEDTCLTRSAELVPINPESVFFTMLAQKDQLVQER